MYSILALLTLLTFAAAAVLPSNPPFKLKDMVPAGTPSPTRVCDISDVKQPAATTPLPAPGADQRLAMIAVGRGTQNYTCADATAASAPQAVGALAVLYDGSCIARSRPGVLAKLTAAAAGVRVADMPTDFGVAGHHFFADNGTPMFAMAESGTLGTTALKKNASAPAPAAADGDVAWLYLTATPQGTTGPVASVYRLNTKAGAAPKTCEGMAPAFQKDYSAEYWFYTA